MRGKVVFKYKIRLKTLLWSVVQQQQQEKKRENSQDSLAALSSQFRARWGSYKGIISWRLLIYS